MLFEIARLEPLGIVASQAAIAMENAALYEGLASARAELLAANTGLSDEVALQTEALRRELLGREEAERARAVLAEEIIRAQKERLAELSVSLLPIAKGVVLVPLVGTMDAPRAEEMLEATLRGASAWSARTVILDVTGMKGSGADAAPVLVRAAHALRLLGVEAVITGIRPDAARALVQMGTELATLTTRGKLRDGIAYALGRVRR
jgi:anti-anti-sigma regulatory factor